MKRCLAPMRRTEEEQAGVSIHLDFGLESCHEARFPDARLTPNQSDPPFPRLCKVPTAQQQLKFFFSANELRLHRTQRFKSATDCTLAQDTGGPSRRSSASRSLRTDIAIAEQTAHETPCACS